MKSKQRKLENTDFALVFQGNDLKEYMCPLIDKMFFYDVILAYNNILG